MHRSPIFVALVVLALTALDAVLVVASLRGWEGLDLDLTTFDYATSAVSIPLGLATGVGLLRRRLWGWTIGVAQVPLGLLFQLGQLPFDDAPWPLAVAALGTVCLFEGAILALLNGRAVREALTPRPPDTGLLGDLPVEGLLAAGLVLVVGGLALEVGWGWMILGLSVVILLARRLRRRARSTIVT